MQNSNDTIEPYSRRRLCEKGSVDTNPIKLAWALNGCTVVLVVSARYVLELSSTASKAYLHTVGSNIHGY